MSAATRLAEELVALATALAVEAAELILRGRDGELDASVKSSATDLVTSMDHASERLIADGIRRVRPGDAIVAEEGTLEAGTSGVAWYVDPIDGTTNYVYGLPGFSVSVAADLDGEPFVGVVVDAMRGDVYSASRGSGARRNGEAIHCSAITELPQALIATGFSYDATRRHRQAEALTHVLPAVRDIRRLGSAAMDLCSAACGRVDGYYERGLNAWDSAAGTLIATEAGATVADGRNRGLVVAAAPGIFAALTELLHAAGADVA